MSDICTRLCFASSELKLERETAVFLSLKNQFNFLFLISYILFWAWILFCLITFNELRQKDRAIKTNSIQIKECIKISRLKNNSIRRYYRLIKINNIRYSFSFLSSQCFLSPRNVSFLFFLFSFALKVWIQRHSYILC